MARTFNGTSQSIECVAPVTAFPFTMACWCRPSSTATQVLMALGVSGGVDRCTLTVGGTQIVGAGANNSGTGANSSFAGSPITGTWFHAACVHESTTSRTVYYNGVVGTPDTNLVAITGLNRLNLAARYNTTLGAFFAGNMAEPGLWSVALSAAEIASLAIGFDPRLIRPQNCVYWNRLIRHSQDLQRSASLTDIGGATTASDHPRIIYP